MKINSVPYQVSRSKQFDETMVGSLTHEKFVFMRIFRNLIGGDSESCYNLGLHFLLGSNDSQPNMKRSIEELEAAHKIDPSNPEILNALGLAYFELEAQKTELFFIPSKTFEFLDRAIAIDSNCVNANLNKAMFIFSELAINSAKVHQSKLSIFCLRALTDQDSSSRIKSAMECIDRVLSQNNSKNREFDTEAAQILESGTSAIVREQGASEDPKFVDKSTTPKTDSSGCFAIRQDPKFHDALLLKAYGFIYLNKPIEALGWIDQLLVVCPDSLLAKHTRGLILFSLEQYEEATACFMENMKVDSERSEFHKLNVIWCLVKQKLYDKALEFIKSVKMQQLPNMFKSFNFVFAGTVRLYQQKFSKAHENFERALSLYSNSYDVMLHIESNNLFALVEKYRILGYPGAQIEDRKAFLKDMILAFEKAEQTFSAEYPCVLDTVGEVMRELAAELRREGKFKEANHELEKSEGCYLEFIAQWQHQIQTSGFDSLKDREQERLLRAYLGLIHIYIEQIKSAQNLEIIIANLSRINEYADLIIKNVKNKSIVCNEFRLALISRMFGRLLSCSTFRVLDKSELKVESNAKLKVQGEALLIDVEAHFKGIFTPLEADGQTSAAAIEMANKVSMEIFSLAKNLSPLLAQGLEEIIPSLFEQFSSKDQRALIFSDYIRQLKLKDPKANVLVALATAHRQANSFEKCKSLCLEALTLNPANTKAQELYREINQHSHAAPPPKPSISKSENILEDNKIKVFIAALSKSLQDSLHNDRVFYQGKAGRRQDNGDRIIEVGAAAADITGAGSVVVNAARVGIAGVRNLYADAYASRTEEYGRHDLGTITKEASAMIAKRYARQIIELDIADPDGAIGLAEYFHSKAMDAVHICDAMKSIKTFWNWICGRENPVLSPEEKLFYAMISDSGSSMYLRKTHPTEVGEHWDAKELILKSGVEINDKKYALKSGSLHKKYGFCISKDNSEIDRLKLIPYNGL